MTVQYSVYVFVEYMSGWARDVGSNPYNLEKLIGEFMNTGNATEVLL